MICPCKESVLCSGIWLARVTNKHTLLVLKDELRGWVWLSYLFYKSTTPTVFVVIQYVEIPLHWWEASLSVSPSVQAYVDVWYHREFSSSVRLKRAFGPRFRTVLRSPRGPRGLAALRPSGRAAGLASSIFVMGWLRDRRSRPWSQSGDAVYELPSNTPRLLLQNQLMGQSWRNTAGY